MGFISVVAGLIFGIWTLKIECQNWDKDCLIILTAKPSEKVIISGSFLSLGFLCLIVPSILSISAKAQKY